MSHSCHEVKYFLKLCHLPQLKQTLGLCIVFVVGVMICLQIPFPFIKIRDKLKSNRSCIMVPSCLQQKSQLHLSTSSVTERQTIIQKFGGRPSDRVLSWSGPEIPYGDPRWQRVDEDGSVFVYSAHYDDAGTVAIVRVIAVARHPLPYTHIWCRYYGCCGSGAVIGNMSGTLQHLRNINRRYISSCNPTIKTRSDILWKNI